MKNGVRKNLTESVEMIAFSQSVLPLRFGSSIPSAVANFANACKYLC